MTRARRGYAFALGCHAALAASVASGRLPPDLPSPNSLKTGALYIEQDVDGRLFNWTTFGLQPRHYLDDAELTALRSMGAERGFHIAARMLDGAAPDTAGRDAADACPVAPSFVLAQAGGGEPAGQQRFLSSNKTPGATTQWAIAVFRTHDYADRAAHTPLALRYRDGTAHGAGAFFGDNTGGVEGCGAGNSFNTQLEAWAVWEVALHLPDTTACPGPGGNGPTSPLCDPGQPHGAAPPFGFNYWWQNRVWADSCGVNLRADGTYYALSVRTNTSQDVAYQVERWDGERWIVHTPWRAENPTTPVWQWTLAEAYVDPMDQGIFMGSTRANDTFTLFVDYFDCGWY